MLSSDDLQVPVFIVHWNRPWECLRTVESFRAQDIRTSIEIIDNASTAANLNLLRDRLPPEVKLMTLAENMGWGTAFNIRLRAWLTKESGPYCILSAHDAIPLGGCLSRMIEAVETTDKIGIICPEYGTGDWPKYSPMRGPHYEIVPQKAAGSIDSVAFPLATLTLYRRECLAKIGLFDERFFAYGDEVEIGLRARRAGWDVCLAWGAFVRNPGSWTPRGLVAYLWARNSLIMAETYGGRASALGRALLIVARSTLMLFTSQSAAGAGRSSLATIRVQAVLDFFRNRVGKPRQEVFDLCST
jgi:hypothetical protein